MFLTYSQDLWNNDLMSKTVAVGSTWKILKINHIYLQQLSIHCFAAAFVATNEVSKNEKEENWSGNYNSPYRILIIVISPIWESISCFQIPVWIPKMSSSFSRRVPTCLLPLCCVSMYCDRYEKNSWHTTRKLAPLHCKPHVAQTQPIMDTLDLDTLVWSICKMKCS